jgi:hypothetical protein
LNQWATGLRKRVLMYQIVQYLCTTFLQPALCSLYNNRGGPQRYCFLWLFLVVVFVVFTAVSHIKIPEHSSATAFFLDKQSTSSSCLHFRKELKLLYIPEQRYSANDHRKDFMINHNESDLQRHGIEPISPMLYLLSQRNDFDCFLGPSIITILLW